MLQWSFADCQSGQSNSTKLSGNIQITQKWANCTDWLKISCPVENCGP